MDSLNELIKILEGPEAKKTSGRNKKRKWREIEALKDKQRLRKELQELDLFSDDIALEELDF
ncbi:MULTISPECIES: DUF3545 family protein [unclassified Pseudoalteromonas]|uniref:DUF3545 family protein n=1 Tax=unclassified Pseudoalteromonas TaxID=194690 RepID=UPI000CF65836|nr:MULTISPECIES: DUF3545 family protein [unclassified Pseudoalteromonas]MBS3797487.1 DUF3545 family protein [Pseudoalteromonas sp. BDTF-M6]